MFIKNKEVNFDKNEIFLYNKYKLQNFGLLILYIIIIFGIMTLLNYYLNFFEYILNFFIIIFEHIKNEIYILKTYLGSFYTAFFGGLFFLPIPFDIFFYNFIDLNPFFLISFFIMGLMISFSINYYIGNKLVEPTKKLITIKKFYKIKVLINKFGGILIFTTNLIPLIFPTQPLSAILGVFNYNKTKFYILIISSNIIKFIILILLFKYYGVDIREWI